MRDHKLAAFALATLFILAHYANAVRSCYAVFNISYNAAAAAACPPET